jgi:hypothetical protein
MTELPATIKQVALIQKLVSERAVTEQVEYGALTMASASELIGALLKPRVAVTEQGMYQLPNGAIYRVQKSRESGNLYAKRLAESGGFEYEQGAITRLSPADRMTLEQAKAFGVETGLCCVCGAFLTDPKSVSRGIGPVCSSRV